MDYPYEIPANWKWVKLSDLYFINPKNNVDDELDAAFIPMEMINAGMNSQFTFTTQKWGKIKKGHTHFRDGDVAFAKISPCFENRKSMIINDLPNGIGAGTTELIVLRNTKILQTYTYWIVNSENFIQGGRQTYSGTVGQQRISMDYVKDYFVPLAPLPEQHRIVARIESLFSKLDEAKEKVQSVLDGFENRRVAILHKAFTGELTKNRNPKIVRLGDYLKPMETKRPSGEIFSYIDIDSIDNKHQIVKKPKIIFTKDAPSRASRAVHANDILFSMVRPYLKNIAYIDEENQNCIASTGFYVCSTKEGLASKYLFHFLCSKDAIDYLMTFMKGDNSPSIKKDDLLNMKMILPSLYEQHKIVRILDSLLSQEQQAKQAAEAVIEQIDIMKKSILARTFRGELGTNDPNDEPARIDV